MKTIWFYFDGENPMKYFYRNDCQPTSGFCFFSSRELVLKHHLKCHGCDFTPTDVDFDSWSSKMIDDADLEIVERWYAEYVSEEGDDECFGEMVLDLSKFKGE